MYQRDYGYLYEEGRGKSVAEIAKLVRREIKVAVGEGLLPTRWTYSVRSDRFAGGCSINVRVKDCPDAWVTCPGYKIGTRHDIDGGGWTATGCGNAWCKAGGEHRDSPSAQYHEVLNEEALAAQMTLQRIFGAFNHDGSDAMTDYFDVNYYGGVEFQDTRSAKWEAEQKAKRQQKRAAKDAATDVHRVAVYGTNGVTVHLAGSVDGRTVLLCGARKSRYSMAERTESGLTCSRCAKREG